MPEFKLDSDIPLPELVRRAVAEPEPEPELEELHLEDTRWVPFKPGKHKCRADQHVPMIGRCSKCGDVFPCPSGNCGHLDCADPSLVGLECKGNGTETPEFLNVVDFGGTGLMARADGGALVIRTGSDYESGE